MSLWKKIEKSSLENPLRHLVDDDNCYYAREYIIEGKWFASETNRLILNFKKTPDRKINKKEWYYKEEAIKQFADELSSILPSSFAITNIPCSICKSDLEYDDRFEQVFEILQKSNPGIKIVYPISIRESLTPSHQGGIRNPNSLYKNLKWNDGLPDNINQIILIDDIITSGAHFKACQKLILQHMPNINIFGVFWARAIKK